MYQFESDRFVLLIEGANAKVSNIQISQNRFRSADTGIRLQAHNRQLEAVIIEHNHFENVEQALIGLIQSTQETTNSGYFRDISVNDNLFLDLG